MIVISLLEMKHFCAAPNCALHTVCPSYIIYRCHASLYWLMYYPRTEMVCAIDIARYLIFKNIIC